MVGLGHVIDVVEGGMMTFISLAVSDATLWPLINGYKCSICLLINPSSIQQYVLTRVCSGLVLREAFPGMLACYRANIPK